MKKNLFALFSLLCVALCFIAAVSAEEAEVVKSGSFGENVTWDLYADGTLIFSGTGATEDSESYSVEGWHSHLASVKHVIFEEGITHIGAYIFYNSRSSIFDTVETITIPSTVDSIGQLAFTGLSGLKGVYISDLESWCRISFDGTDANPLCNKVDLYLNGKAVTDLVIPRSVTKIPEYAFYGSAGIHTVTVHKNVTAIGSYAFNSSSCLKHLIFQGSAVTFGQHVFTLSELTVHYPAGDRSWGSVITGDYGGNVDWASYPGSAPEITDDTPCDRILWNYDEATQTLTLSGYGPTGDFTTSNTTSVRPAWDSCRKTVTTLIVEEGITGLGSFAFQDCQNLTSVSLPSTLRSIGMGTFEGCIALTGVQLPEGLTSLGQSALSRTAISSVVIPSGVTTISSSLFEGCGNLRTITLHDGITTIADSAFRGCGIRELELPAALTLLGSSALENTPLESITIPEGVTAIYMHTFSSCSNLTSVRLPDGLTEIGDYAFRGCTSLTGIELPEALLTLGTQAFVYSGLTEATVPSGLLQYGKNALGYISDITFTGSAPAFAEDCFIWQTVTVHYPAGYSGWEEAAAQSYGGTVTWVPYESSVPESGGHEHSYTEYRNPPSCEGWGGYHYSCACGHTYEGEQIPPTGHSWGPWRIVNQETETDPGLQERLCSLCGGTEIQMIPAGINPFVDVKREDYFYIPVRWAHTGGVTAGTSDTTFAPGAICTRAQVVTFLWRANGCQEPAGAVNPFTDVNSSDYFYKAVLWAVEKGITAGTSDTTFTPNAPCTRGQVVTFLHRFHGSVEPWDDRHTFTDIAPSDYFYKAVLWCRIRGVTQGTSETTFSPNAPCTRGQVVTFLYRSSQ